MCECHDSNGNGFGDTWWTDKLIYLVIYKADNIALVDGYHRERLVGEIIIMGGHARPC